MSSAVYYVSFKLKVGASVPDFLLAAETLNNEFISKQKGYVSWEQVVDGETWADLITFESIDDLKSFKEISKNPTELALNFYSFINLNSCKEQHFTVERSYQQPKTT
ncbi:MAG: hypothetical protein FWE96_06200 [Coriobacteriia bacterium]|nr:hypothetical protein [Coriobacteriia bacterium]